MQALIGLLSPRPFFLLSFLNFYMLMRSMPGTWTDMSQAKAEQLRSSFGVKVPCIFKYPPTGVRRPGEARGVARDMFILMSHERCCIAMATNCKTS